MVGLTKWVLTRGLRTCTPVCRAASKGLNTYGNDSSPDLEVNRFLGYRLPTKRT